MQAADCLAAFDASFAAGLLEALGRLAAEPSQPVLLVAYDAPYPEPLHAARPIADSFAVALVLAAMDASDRGARITAEIARCESPTILADVPLENLRRTIPAARALPLLALLARATPGRVCVDYLDGLALALEVEP
jgi:hypothetical protein